MDMAFIQDFISPIALVICLGVGYIIKNCVPNDAVNRFIPFIVAVIGVGICTWSAWTITPLVICQGIVSGLASTGMYEAFKNLLNIKTDE